MKKSVWLIGIGILVLLIIVFFSYSYTSLKQVKISEIEITNVESVDLSGFTLAGTLTLENPSIFAIKLTSVDYDVYLHNQSYYKGTVQGETLSPKTKTELEFSSESSWERTVALFWDMLNAGETTAILEGEITLKFFIFTITLPFEKEVNIESYLKSFAATQAQNAINKAREKMQQGLGNVLSRLST